MSEREYRLLTELDCHGGCLASWQLEKRTELSHVGPTLSATARRGLVERYTVWVRGSFVPVGPAVWRIKAKGCQALAEETKRRAKTRGAPE